MSRHRKEHSDRFTKRSWATDQRRIELDVRAIDNEIPQLLFVWAEGKEEKKTENERKRVTGARESRELLRGKMPRSNFRLREAVSYSAEPLPKPDTSSITFPALTVSPTSFPAPLDLYKPRSCSLILSPNLVGNHHTEPTTHTLPATQVSTSYWENGRWSIGTESRKLGSTPLSGFPLGFLSLAVATSACAHQLAFTLRPPLTHYGYD